MREPLEMVTASLMQNIVQIRKKKHLFRDQFIFLKVGKSSVGALGVESPTVGPFKDVPSVAIAIRDDCASVTFKSQPMKIGALIDALATAATLAGEPLGPWRPRLVFLSLGLLGHGILCLGL